MKTLQPGQSGRLVLQYGLLDLKRLPQPLPRFLQLLDDVGRGRGQPRDQEARLCPPRLAPEVEAHVEAVEEEGHVGRESLGVRAPRALRHGPARRAVDGLLAGLDEEAGGKGHRDSVVGIVRQLVASVVQLLNAR